MKQRMPWLDCVCVNLPYFILEYISSKIIILIPRSRGFILAKIFYAIYIPKMSPTVELRVGDKCIRDYLEAVTGFLNIDVPLIRWLRTSKKLALMLMHKFMRR